MDKKEAAKQKFNERTASKRFKLPEGDTTFRVLPNARGLEKAEYIEYRMHSNVGARNAYLRCGKKMSGEEGECWLCDVQIPKLEKSGKKSHRAAAEALKAKDCFAVQIIYQVDGKWVGPTLWEMSAGVANKLLGVMSRRDVSHPQKGYNLTISRKGTTMTSTKYGDIDRDDEKSEVPEKLLAKLKPFGEVLKKYDEAVMKAEYFGHEQEEEEEEEEETKKPAEEEEEEETPKPKKPKKPAAEEEGEESEEVEEETEEEEEEKPKPKKPKKPVEEEEEEVTEEDDDSIPDLEEEEEEEKPAKKPKKPAKDEEEEESESEPEEEEEEKPKKPKKPSKNEEEESEEEEEEPKPKKPKKPTHDDDDE